MIGLFDRLLSNDENYKRINAFPTLNFILSGYGLNENI